MQRYFITGIGTEVGKTVASAIITESLEADYWKPIQAGDLDDSDTHKVQRLVSNTKTQFHENAFALHTPMSPHAAAEIDGITLEAKSIHTPHAATKNEYLVVEGAGGLLVPINDTETILDLIQPEDKIILVSRHYLGSINHTLLSAALLKAKTTNKVALLFNGDAHPTTEEIIQKITKLPVIGRIDADLKITPETIKKYATAFEQNLKAL